MSCIGRKKRNNESNSSTIKFSRSDGAEAPKAVTNLILSYTNQTLEEFDDNDFAQKLFFSCFDQLNTPEMHQIISGEKISNYRILTAHAYALLSLTNETCIAITFTTDLPNHQYTSLIQSMCKNIDRHLPNHSSFLKMTSSIFLFLWNLSDQTIVVPSLVRAGLVEYLVRWLSRADELSISICDSLVNIAHNIARHDEGNDALNQCNALKVLKRVQTAEGIKNSEDGLLTAAMTLALLSTPEQIRNDSTNLRDILDQLLQITIDIAANKSPSALENPTFDISEPLIVLVRLFVHDESLHYVLNEAKTNPPSSLSSTIQLFIDLLIRFRPNKQSKDLDQITFVALLNIFWSISFHSEYQNELRSHEELLRIIRNFSRDDEIILFNKYIPRSLQSFQKSIDGILFNLDQIDYSIEHNSKTIKPLIMLSYSHANRLICDQILQLLDQKSDLYDVWVDLKYCQGSNDVWERIAQGIKRSHLILCLISNEYCESKSCRQEITYALDKLNKPVVPIYLEKPNISEWLEIRLASKKYIRFQKLDQQQLDDRKVDELFTTIQATITIDVPLDNHDPVIQSNIIDEKPIISWTNENIRKWFDENGISRNIYDMYDFQTGLQLLMYAEYIHEDWKKQYQRYSLRYAKKYNNEELTEHDFIKFVSAMRQLPTLENKSDKKYTRNKHSNCTIL